MKDSWTDFEKWTFETLTSIDRRLSKLEGKVIATAAIVASIVGLIARFL